MKSKRSAAAKAQDFFAAKTGGLKTAPFKDPDLSIVLRVVSPRMLLMLTFQHDCRHWH
jgi:hypothetical protein